MEGQRSLEAIPTKPLYKTSMEPMVPRPLPGKPARHPIDLPIPIPWTRLQVCLSSAAAGTEIGQLNQSVA